MNWPGSGFDPETATFYTQANNSGVTVGKYEEEEFEQVRADKQVSNGKSIRKPRWEADPDYGQCGTNQPRRAAPPVRPSADGRHPWQHRTPGTDPGARRSPDHQAALRRGRGHRPQRRRQDHLPGASRRDAGQRPQPPAAEGHEHPEDGPGRQRRRDGHQDDGRIAGEAQITTPPGRARGAMLRAYDKKDRRTDRRSR